LFIKSIIRRQAEERDAKERRREMAERVAHELARKQASTRTERMLVAKPRAASTRNPKASRPGATLVADEASAKPRPTLKHEPSPNTTGAIAASHEAPAKPQPLLALDTKPGDTDGGKKAGGSNLVQRLKGYKPFGKSISNFTSSSKTLAGVTSKGVASDKGSLAQPLHESRAAEYPSTNGAHNIAVSATAASNTPSDASSSRLVLALELAPEAT
jgi:hypothetical protein